MRITISGKAGAGKSTVARLLAKKLNLKHYSIGDLMREMASEKGITLIELNRLAENDKSIDFELDEKLRKLGKSHDNFVVDGRLTAFFIRNADVRVFLDADAKIRAQRILKDRRHDEENQNLKETIINIKKRELSEKKRYMKYYGVNYLDRKLYNFIIDTSGMTIKQVIGSIVKLVKHNQKSG